MPWLEADFRQRVLARAQELGKSWPEVARAAKVHPSTLYNPGRDGRLINKKEDIANALDWSLCDILACGISQPQLESAVAVVSRSRSGLTPERASLVVRVYGLICARERAGKPVGQSYIEGCPTRWADALAWTEESRAPVACLQAFERSPSPPTSAVEARRRIDFRRRQRFAHRLGPKLREDRPQRADAG